MEELRNVECVHIRASLTHKRCVSELELIINGAAHARPPFTDDSPRSNQGRRALSIVQDERKIFIV